MAQLGEPDFERAQFDPVEMPDTGDERNEYHFRVHLLGDRVELHVFAFKDDEPRGYAFQVLGEAENDLFALMVRLVERMRSTLAIRHLEMEHCELYIEDFVARGWIEWDENEESRVPLNIIDRRDYLGGLGPHAHDR